MKYQHRIVVDREIVHGKPAIKGTRIPVYVVLNLLAGGMNAQDVLGEYPNLTKEDILACLEYAAELAQEEVGILEVEGIR
ncbi:MAG: DUF433 domain-containing protein [Chloroflexi bacterium]|nr:DUF433 domain-containing protein [Chloroflexota bacterium]